MKKSVSYLKTLCVLCAVAMFAIGMISCNKNNGDNTTDIPVSGLMAFNLAPDKASAGVALSGNPIVNNGLPFTSYTGGYLGIYPGSRSVDYYDFYTGNSIASTPGVFTADRYYSSYLIGANNNYRSVLVEDNFDSLAASDDKAYVRYINAIPDSTSPSVTISVGGTSVVNEAAAYARVSDFTAVTPGSVDITVNNGGTINATRNLTLAGKTAYTVLLVGMPGAASTEQAVQIKYVTNGTLTDSTAARTNTAARSVITQ